VCDEGEIRTKGTKGTVHLRMRELGPIAPPMQRCPAAPHGENRPCGRGGVPHHITQRGNDRQNVFLSTEDRRFYLDLLRTKCNQDGVALLGYRLMTNHVHLIAIPEKPDSFAPGLGSRGQPQSPISALWLNQARSAVPSISPAREHGGSGSAPC
jgi:hypothetical protein